MTTKLPVEWSFAYPEVVFPYRTPLLGSLHRSLLNDDDDAAGPAPTHRFSTA